MSDDTVLLEIEDDIAMLTLNRPERLNALSYALIDRLMAHLDLRSRLRCGRSFSPAQPACHGK